MTTFKKVILGGISQNLCRHASRTVLWSEYLSIPTNSEIFVMLNSGIIPLSSCIVSPYIWGNIWASSTPMLVCKNICLRLYGSIQASGHYSTGIKYCRSCEYYLITLELFCKCCGGRLRANPAAREYREKVRAKRKLIPVVWCQACYG